MSRPVKCRKVCRLPKYKTFVAEGVESGRSVGLTVEEYEAVRLMDKAGFTQEEAAELMKVARTTLQRIYTDARAKIASAIVDGDRLIIEGGTYVLCDGKEKFCRCGGCEKHTKLLKESNIMVIAVTYEDGQIFQHFGHSEHFKLYEVVAGKVTESAVVNPIGSGHAALADYLAGYNVGALICGGIGEGAKDALKAKGIAVYGGVSGDADQAVADYINGALNYNPEEKCTHHDEHHSCGEHGCGQHTCGPDGCHF